MKKVITIGEVLVEIIATETGDGFLEAISLMGPFPSGAPAIFIDQTAKLGQPCGIIGRVGQDDFGRVNIDRLRRDGVDVSALALDPERPTGSAFVRYRTDGSRDFVYNIRHSASGAIAPSPAASALIESADHLHVMGSALSSPSIAEMVWTALAQGDPCGARPALGPRTHAHPDRSLPAKWRRAVTADRGEGRGRCDPGASRPRCARDCRQERC
jgi:tagatose kinase